MDLFSEVLEASILGLGVKAFELKPKIEHINDLYNKGQKHEAYSLMLGLSTEVVLLGVLIEALGVADLFMSALSFSGDWLMALGQSSAGIFASTKASTYAGEQVEDAAKEKFEHEIKKEKHGWHLW